MVRRRRSPILVGLALLVSVAGGVGLGWLGFTHTSPDPARASGAGSEPPATASATASAAAGAPPEEPASPGCPRPGAETVCLRSLFPDGTFLVDPEPDLSFVCGETSPVRGGGEIRSAVVRGAGREVTAAMRQWAVLGWYEMATFAAMRVRCCPDPAPLTLPPHPPMCDAIGPALDALASAVGDPGSGDDARNAAMADFGDAVQCIAKARAHKVFGQPGGPDGGAVTAFETVSRQIAEAPGCDAE